MSLEIAGADVSDDVPDARAEPRLAIRAADRQPRRQALGRYAGSTFSNTAASPWPPPMHIVSRP